MLDLLPTLLCASVLATLVYRYDLYEKEPAYMLLLAIGLGMLGCWAIGYVEDFLLLNLPGGASLLNQAAVAGVTEELLKLATVLLIAVLVPSHFNDPLDGLIYGAMTGLGFAIAESYFYVRLAGGLPFWTVSGPEIIRLVLHLLMGALTCFALGLAKFRVRRWTWMLLGSVSASMTIHFLWDYACGIPSADEVGATTQRLMAVALMLGATTLFGVVVMYGVEHSANVHGGERRKRLWGWPFTLLFRSRD